MKKPADDEKEVYEFSKFTSLLLTFLWSNRTPILKPTPLFSKSKIE